MTFDNLNQVLRDIRENQESMNNGKPYYNEQGFKKETDVTGADAYWPQHNPNDLPKEDNWQDNTLEII